MLRVIYRCCDKVEAVNGLPRPFELDKEKTLKVCFKSLVMSLVDKEHTMHVIGDRLSEDTISFMKSLHEEAEIDNSSEALGNGGSILKCFELAETFDDNDIIYFCEDDYLHFYPNFYDKITDFLEKHKDNPHPVFVHPSDYPDQYSRLFKRSYILITDYGHFREVSSTTFTLLTHRFNFMKFVDIFKLCAPDADDGGMSEIFGKEALCFSPLPGLATHMHEGVMSPFISWDTVVDYVNKDIKAHIGHIPIEEIMDREPKEKQEGNQLPKEEEK